MVSALPSEPALADYIANNKLPTRHPGSNSLLKLRIWELDMYDKIVYLSFDTLIFTAIDEIFDCLTPCAVPDLATAVRPDWLQRTSPVSSDDLSVPAALRKQSKAKEASGYLIPRNEFSDFMISGQVLVIKPDKTLFVKMLEKTYHPHHFHPPNGYYIDEQFLLWYFRGQWTYLPFHYNVCARCALIQKPDLWQPKWHKVIHVYGHKRNPWDSFPELSKQTNYTGTKPLLIIFSIWKSFQTQLYQSQTLN